MDLQGLPQSMDPETVGNKKLNISPAGQQARKDTMREFHVRAYEDHWLVREEGDSEEKIVMGDKSLSETLSWQPWVAPPTAKAVTKKRKRRTKAELEAIKPEYRKVEAGTTTV